MPSTLFVTNEQVLCALSFGNINRLRHFIDREYSRVIVPLVSNTMAVQESDGVCDSLFRRGGGREVGQGTF